MAGQKAFGENKVKELKTKAGFFKENNYKDVQWHFIGHLQSNKVKDLLKIPNLFAIHSIDSIKLLQEVIHEQKLLKGAELKLFLQVNTSHEAEKSGFETLVEVLEAVKLLEGNSVLKFCGLMTMGTIRTENFETEAKRCFMELQIMKDKIQKKEGLSDLKLSMGMSQDYAIAVNEGADYVRIGTAIFKR